MILEIDRTNCLECKRQKLLKFVEENCVAGK